MKTTAPKKLHWYRGEADKGDNVCGKGTNRTDWTSREEVWNAPENAARRCKECLTGR